jgi:ATP-dependent Clp protease ATP-binding subunit ClpB
LNRVDEILLFHRLERGQMGASVDIQLKRLQKLLDTREITIEVTEAARDWLANEGYDSAYGARPLRRVIQRAVQDELAEKLLAGEITDGSTVKVDAGDGGLVILPVIEGEVVDTAAE